MSPERPRGRRGRNQLTRREFLGISARTAIAGGLIFATGGGAALTLFLIDQTSKNKEIETLLQEYQKKGEELDIVLARFDKGFERFTSKTQQLIAQSGANAQERAVLATPFEIARINSSNPDRNGYFLNRKDLATRRSLTKGGTTLANPNYFLFKFLDGGIGAASFSPPTRTMRINPLYNPNNDLDNLITFHELVHVGQDNKDREEIHPDIYNAFFNTAEASGRRRANGLYEASAYIFEIHLLNLFTNGSFRADILNGSLNPAKHRAFLNARPEQDETILDLGEIAVRYYNSKSSLVGVDQRFLDYITALERSKGAELNHYGLKVHRFG